MPQFTILSDVHLEFIPNELKEIHKLSGENLLLCGDIGKPDTKIFKMFIEHCSKQFKRTFFICGNHEYYGYQMADIEAKCVAIAEKYDNVFFMNRRTIEFDDFAIAGATLWSHIPPDLYKWIYTKINDYRCIKMDKHRYFKPEDGCALHQADVEFLNQAINTAAKPLVVMTHHAPLYDCVIPEYKTPKNHAFCTDLPQLWRSPIKIWAFGHTHCPFKLDSPQGLHFRNNPVGYPQELQNHDCCAVENCEFNF